jgi:hypothetical protein
MLTVTTSGRYNTSGLAHRSRTVVPSLVIHPLNPMDHMIAARIAQHLAYQLEVIAVEASLNPTREGFTPEPCTVLVALREVVITITALGGTRWNMATLRQSVASMLTGEWSVLEIDMVA